jgi:thiamine phosphate synthase YjbQ (UPF0047 family)
MLLQQQIQIDTRGRGTHDLTGDVQSAVRQSGVQSGICNVFICHTSASLMICENADPAVLDMPAHVRSVLTQSDLNIPVMEGRCALGTWQGIYLWEHRHRGHRRTVIVTILGE